jgi:tetratricopeptide (TPR) repeat protein
MLPVDQATSLYRRARSLEQQRRWSEAAQAAQEAVEIVDRNAAAIPRREADLSLLKALCLWGGALRQQGNLREAELVLRRALTVAGAYPGEPLRIAAACTDLAMLSQTSGRFLEAEQLLRRALAMIERTDERNGPAAATVHRNLAILEHARGNYQRGLTAARKACQIRAKAAGPDDPETVMDRMTLAGLHDSLRRYDESRPIYVHALGALERVYGPEHYYLIAVCLKRLAAIECAEGRPADAIARYRRALALEEKLFGPLHPDTLETRRKMAQVVEDRGRSALARHSITRALERVATDVRAEVLEACCRS